MPVPVFEPEYDKRKIHTTHSGKNKNMLIEQSGKYYDGSTGKQIGVVGSPLPEGFVDPHRPSPNASMVVEIDLKSKGKGKTMEKVSEILDNKPTE